MATNRMYRAILLGRCMIHAVIWGTAKHIPSDFTRIIVVPTGKLGDVVCCTPVLRAIRNFSPLVHIIVAGTTRLHKPLLADSGLVDEYLDFDEPSVISRIKERYADAAVITGPSFDSIAPFYLSGVPLVVGPVVMGGFSPAETRPYKMLQRLIKTFPYWIGEYAPRERLKALEPLGIFSNDTKKQLGFSDSADNKIKLFFVENNIDLHKDFIVGISPSAGNRVKEWPADRFAQIADYLVEKHHAKVFITGGKGDIEKANEVIKCLNPKTVVVDTSGRFNLDELKALIAKSKLFISVDTGPIYIAEAFGVPTIDIVGPMDEREQPPVGHKHKIVFDTKRTKPQMHILNAKTYNVNEVIRQVLGISVEMVKEQIDVLINNV